MRDLVVEGGLLVVIIWLHEGGLSVGCLRASSSLGSCTCGGVQVGKRKRSVSASAAISSSEGRVVGGLS